MWAARPTRFAIIKIMRTWGSSGAAEAIRRAQAVSRVARQAGCDLDEARAVLAGQLSRRGFLATAGAAAVASVACNLATDPFRFHYNPDPPTEFLAPGIEIESGGLIFLALPTDSDAQIQPTAR